MLSGAGVMILRSQAQTIGPTTPPMLGPSQMTGTKETIAMEEIQTVGMIGVRLTTGEIKNGNRYSICYSY